MPGLTRCRSSRRSGPAWACRPIAPRRRITPRSRRPADPVRIVVAPDSFKGSIGAAEAATALAEGWHRARPGDELVCLPLADGGEGTLEVLAAATPADRKSTRLNSSHDQISYAVFCLKK